MPIDPRLMDILVCPVCRADLGERAEGSRLACTGCGRVYPVRDGIPLMLVEYAEEPPADGPDRPAS